MAAEGRRRHARQRVSWGSFIATLDGSRCVQCQTRDFSHAGARVRMDDQHTLPASVCLLDVRNRLAYESRIAWHKAPEMGLEFTKVYRFDEVPSPGLRQAIEQVLR